jgi:16S rRNA (cytidine1402-2'-O)-methyltransferase
MTTLTLLTLPIGNAQDITLRGLDHLKKTQLIVCEDTRNIVKLLHHLGVDMSEKEIISYHDQSSENDLKKVINAMRNGRDMTYTSDAGSPVVSDPAYPLIREALKLGIKLESLPGVSSPIVALELSGLSPIPFHFHGFLPRDHGPRKTYLLENTQGQGTHIFFEGVSRVEKCIDDICHLFPDAHVVVARELTKMFESVYRFEAKDWEHVKAQIEYRGEFIILYSRDRKDKQLQTQEIVNLAQTVLEKKGRSKELSKLLAELLQMNAKDVYSQLLPDKIE